jgi:hypothetical protein
MRVNLLCNARKLTTRGEVVCSVALAPPAAAPGGAAGDGAGPRSPASGPAASEATGADAAGAAGRWPPMMRFSVADTGAGVDPAEAALLFRPFGQLQRGDSGGTGLGLASVAVRARAPWVVRAARRPTVRAAPCFGSRFRTSRPRPGGLVTLERRAWRHPARP